MFSHKQPRIFDIRLTSDVSDNETDKINKYISARNSRNRRGFLLIWLVSLVVSCVFAFYFLDTLFFK
jgi:hypothetical protein